MGKGGISQTLTVKEGRRWFSLYDFVGDLQEESRKKDEFLNGKTRLKQSEIRF